MTLEDIKAGLVKEQLRMYEDGPAYRPPSDAMWFYAAQFLMKELEGQKSVVVCLNQMVDKRSEQFARVLGVFDRYNQLTPEEKIKAWPSTRTEFLGVLGMSWDEDVRA